MSDLRPLYRAMADKGTNFHGLSIIQYAPHIAQLIEQYGAKSVLDFGCGRGDAYFEPYSIHLGWRVMRPTLYDPAFAMHDNLPLTGQRFDAVLCSDVLEHVPEHDVPEFVANLFVHANKFVWASVCCRLAKKLFPDGSNLHVTVRRIEWWRAHFEAQCGGIPWVLTETP